MNAPGEIKTAEELYKAIGQGTVWIVGYVSDLDHFNYPGVFPFISGDVRHDASVLITGKSRWTKLFTNWFHALAYKNKLFPDRFVSSEPRIRKLTAA